MCIPCWFSALLVLSPADAAQEPPPPSSPRPITESIARVVERYVDARGRPCLRAADEKVPCFPISVEAEGPSASVAESIGVTENPDAPVPGGAPTIAEMGPYRPKPYTKPVYFGGFDPGCQGKKALQKLKGRNTVFYLYRVTDTSGPRAALYDRALTPEAIAALPLQFEFLGRFDGECEALAAYRRLMRAGR